MLVTPLFHILAFHERSEIVCRGPRIGPLLAGAILHTIGYARCQFHVVLSTSLGILGSKLYVECSERRQTALGQLFLPFGRGNKLAACQSLSINVMSLYSRCGKHLIAHFYVIACLDRSGRRNLLVFLAGCHHCHSQAANNERYLEKIVLFHFFIVTFKNYSIYVSLLRISRSALRSPSSRRSDSCS